MALCDLCCCDCAGAQCAHAACGVLEKYKPDNEMLFRHWEAHGQPKIALKGKDWEEMVGSLMFASMTVQRFLQLPWTALGRAAPVYIWHAMSLVVTPCMKPHMHKQTLEFG